MERDGEGMVAIIEGLQDSGIAITLVNNRRSSRQEKSRHKTRSFGFRRSHDVSKTQSSVETSTDTLHGVNKSAQICDGRYASSYQLAHCRMIPTSPPVAVPEFPPQRAEPCRTQGNFELGYGNGESWFSSGSVPKQTTSYRNASIMSERGSAYTNRSTKMDPFADSLRRYPSLSPDRTMSSDFVQRLITYTQTKHYSKNSHQSKSMRSLRDRSAENRTSKFCTTETPNNNSNTPKVNKNKPRCYTNADMKEEKKRTRYKDSLQNDTYDYLKTPRRYPKSSELRSMKNMSRCVRETLRQIYDYKPMATLQVCPEANRRCSQKKVHIICDKDRPQCASVNAMDVQTSTQCEAATTTRCVIPTTKLCCFCKKPLPCDCKLGPPNLLPVIETKELPVSKLHCLCSKNKDKIRRMMEDEIYEWLNEIPVYANENAEAKATRQAKIKQLSDTLKDLNAYELDEKGKDEIIKCIEALPIWYPGDKREQDIFKEQLADKLLNRLKRVSKKDKFTDEVSGFVDRIVFKGRDNEGRAVNKENVVDTIAERLKSIAVDRSPDDNAYRAELRAEILDTLQELPIEVEGNGKKELNQLAESLADTLVKVPPQDISQPKPRRLSAGSMENKVQRKILEWLNDNPELPKSLVSDNKKNKTMISDLENTLHKYEGDDLNDENVQSKMQAEIKGLLDDMVKINDSKSKDKVSRRLIQKLISSGALNESENKSAEINKSISDWVENIPEISSNSDKDKKKIIQNLSDKLIDLEDDDDVRYEIHKWLSETLDNKAEHLNEKSIDDLVEKLIHDIKTFPRVNKNGEKNDELKVRKRWEHHDDVPDTIQEEISRIIDQGPTKLSKSKKQDLKDKIANVLAKNIPRLSEAGSKTLPERNRKTSFASNSIPIKSNLKKYVSDEVSDILNKFDVKPDYHHEVAISDALEKQIANGTVSDKTEEDIYDTLLDADVPEDMAVDIANELVKKADEIALAVQSEAVDSANRSDELSPAPRRSSLSSTNRALDNRQSTLSRSGTSKLSSGTRRRSTTFSDYPNTSTSGEPKYGRTDAYTDFDSEAFKEGAEREMLDLLGEVTGEDSVNLRNRRKGVIGEIMCKIGDIIYNPNMLEEDKIKEVIRCLGKLSLPPKVSRERFASELINRIRSSTSANRSGRKEERRISFHPGAESSRIDDYQDDSKHTQKQMLDETFNRPNRKSTASLEQEYNDELLNIINAWIDELPIDLNATEDKGFKETMSKDLASDIVDRLKYLQLNPGVKSTNQEELEHLKYQVFRWLNKLVSADDLSPVLPGTQDLMDRIKQVDAPQLVYPSGKRRESKIIQGGIPNYSDALKDEISIWLDEIPPYLLKASGNSQHQQMVSRLANLIKQQKENKNINLNNEIEKCLNEVVDDKQYLNKIAEDLKNRLNNKGYTGDTSWIPMQDTSQFIEENFEGGMMDWLKDLPLYQQRNPQEKRMQEQSIKALAKDLKRIAENAQPSSNTDELFIDEIIRHLKDFPMDPVQKYDDDFQRKTAAQLLHYLKGLQMFQDISQRQTRPTGEYFTAAIEDWLNTIPMTPGSSITKQNLFGVLKDEFITRFNHLRKHYDPSSDTDEKMRKEIKEYLLLLPIEASKKQDQKYLNDKVDELLKNLQVVPREQSVERENIKDQILGIIKDLSRKSITVDSKQSYKKPADVLYDNIENWCEDLPIHLGDSPADKEKEKSIKQNIASKLINKVGELNMNPEIFKDDVLYQDLLQDEAENLLSAIPTNPELEKSLPILMSNLTENVKEANRQARNELIGHEYKQQLKDSISKILPAPSNLSSEEEASFELLKDSVADAFINLHYIGDDEALKNKYKKKIKDEVSKFCSDFIKRYPNTPIDNERLNQDLYNALRNVTVPNEESMKSEVGQARIKDTIHDWVKDLPLKEQLEGEQLQQSKILSVLAKRLHDMEKEESFHPNISNDEKKQKEVVRWIKKLPISPENGDKIDRMAAKLVNDLKRTEQSRRFSGSSMQSALIDATEKNKHGKSCSCCPNIPPSTLSREDSAHLRRIRERTPMPIVCKPPQYKDAAISPCPVDACTQTEIRTWDLHGREILSNDQVMTQTSGRIVHQVEKSKASSCAQSENNYEVSPNVVIREYQWDSTAGSKVFNQLPNTQSSKSQCSPICPEENLGRNYNQPVTSSSAYKQNGQSCPPVRKPCAKSQPYVTWSSNQTDGPRMTPQEIPCTSPPKCSRTNRERDFPQPCLNREPGFSRLDEDYANRSKSRPHADHSKQARKRHRDFDFPVRFPDEDDFWDASCRPRMTPYTTDEELESIGREREKELEKVKCRCKERVYTKCAGRRVQTCPNQVGKEAANKCSMCSVLHCPYPSFLYFRE